MSLIPCTFGAHSWFFFGLMLVFSVLNSNDVYMNSSGILASPSNVASFPAHETYQLFN